MHRTRPKLFRAYVTLALGLALAVPCLAQPETKSVRVSTLNVPINATQRVQMAKKQKILRVENPKPDIVRVVPDEFDPTSVLITGISAGSVRVTLTGEDKTTEEIVVSVQQFDIEYLRGIWRQAVPGAANINAIPSANNTLILTGTVPRSEDIDMLMNVTRSIVGDRIISGLRVGGVMQVQLEVCVARVSRSEIRRMSFEFINFGQKHVLANGMGGLVIPNTGISGTFPGLPSFTNSISAVNGAPINVFFAVFDPEQDFFGLLQALRDEALVKLQSFPKVVVMSGRQVSFLSGGEQAVPVPAGLGQVGVQFEEFGTRLNALPIVLGNGKIHLDLEPEVSSLDEAAGTSIGGTVVAGRTTQRLRTTVELESGQTLCLAGFIQTAVSGSTRKVPILGDLPFVGAAFSRKQFAEVEEELVILVTPRLVDAMSCDQLPKWLPGQESRSPDDFELFLEGILEAPRGPREIFPNQRYRAAHMNGPTASMFPCAGTYGPGHGGHGHCGNGHCSVKGTSLKGGMAIGPMTAGAHQSAQPLPTAPPPMMESSSAVQPAVLPHQEMPAEPIGGTMPPSGFGDGQTGQPTQEPKGPGGQR
jgi:pilus assembly protein CpaC